jgi:HPt (histidine-containing phosphotransfer) domain-containing protein
MERLIVEVDPELRDLIPEFLRRKRADAIAIQIALDKGDFTTVAALGHKLKGEGGSFGFDVITDIGAALEGTAKNRDADSAHKLAMELSYYLENVEVVSAPE